MKTTELQNDPKIQTVGIDSDNDGIIVQVASGEVKSLGIAESKP